MDILLIASGGIVLVGLVLVALFMRGRPRRLNVAWYQQEWKDMQKLLANKNTWAQAVIDADKLLDRALKEKRFGGKAMGERLTKAQRVIGDNEGVWFGHKLRTKLDSDESIKLKEADVKQALIGIREALKDLGALPDGK
ncbi:MAG TPA: hypothetical protein VFM05_05935 [Candidatus Saccharimonadales bacterium]|nr:hypothetical protein [Candidatus Saccharimonadales bacterium]